MLTVKSLNPDKRLAVTIAIFFAEDVLPIFEKEYPEDKRPRKAIEAAKAWIVNPCRETASAAYADAYPDDASYAANAAHAAAANAAYATAAAANAAVTSAAAANTSALAAAAHAANGSAVEYYQNKSLYIHRKLLMLLPQILEYKIHSKNRFESAEEVFVLLPKQSQQRFLFHIDCLR